MTVSRRSFVGGFAAALGYLGVGTEIDLFAQGRTQGAGGAARVGANSNDYDSFAHLSSNENCWGPPESVMKAMNSCVGADLNGDKRPDLVCTGAGGAIRWYENVGKK